jgi:hypothetical protein
MMLHQLHASILPNVIIFTPTLPGLSALFLPLVLFLLLLILFLFPALLVLLVFMLLLNLLNYLGTQAIDGAFVLLQNSNDLLSHLVEFLGHIVVLDS